MENKRLFELGHFENGSPIYQDMTVKEAKRWEIWNGKKLPKQWSSRQRKFVDVFPTNKLLTK